MPFKKNVLSPLTYWVWRTVRAHGPLTTEQLRELLPEMPHDRLTSRLFNLRSGGYLTAQRAEGARFATFDLGPRSPDDVDGLEQLLAQNLVYRGEAEEDGYQPRGLRADDGGDDEPAAPLHVPPPQPTAPHNHWRACAATFGDRPPVVRPGSLDALRLASRRFGRSQHLPERALGVVEAGCARG